MFAGAGLDVFGGNCRFVTSCPYWPCWKSCGVAGDGEFTWGVPPRLASWLLGFGGGGGGVSALKAGFMVGVGVVEMLSGLLLLDVRGSGEAVICGEKSLTRDPDIVPVYALLTASFHV